MGLTMNKSISEEPGDTIEIQRHHYLTLARAVGDIETRLKNTGATSSSALAAWLLCAQMIANHKNPPAKAVQLLGMEPDEALAVARWILSYNNEDVVLGSAGWAPSRRARGVFDQAGLSRRHLKIPKQDDLDDWFYHASGGIFPDAPYSAGNVNSLFTCFSADNMVWEKSFSIAPGDDSPGERAMAQAWSVEDLMGECDAEVEFFQWQGKRFAALSKRDAGLRHAMHAITALDGEATPFTVDAALAWVNDVDGDDLEEIEEIPVDSDLLWDVGTAIGDSDEVNVLIPSWSAESAFHVSDALPELTALAQNLAPHRELSIIQAVSTYCATHGIALPDEMETAGKPTGEEGRCYELRFLRPFVAVSSISTEFGDIPTLSHFVLSAVNASQRPERYHED